MSKDPRIYLTQILERLERISHYTRAGRDAFFSDPMIQDAVIRNLEVIGEAAKRVDATYRAAHAEVPWRSLAALRDVLIHQYEGVSLPEVWALVEKNLPELRSTLAAILPPPEQLEREINDDQEGGASE